jgi:hypothetical protein
MVFCARITPARCASINAALIDATIDGYLKHTPGGYFQMDLSDLPYPYLAGNYRKSRGQRVGETAALPLDWNQLKAFHADSQLEQRQSAN